MTLHGPTELYDVKGHRLVEKVRRARFAICTSHYMRSQLQGFVDRRDWPKLHVLRCGIDVSRFSPSPNGARPSDRTTRVLAVGRLDVRKGHIFLVEALGRLVREGLDVRLTIVGEGPERGSLEQLARDLGVADRLELPGAVGQDDIPAYFRDADIFSMLSFAEGVPTVLMEAMASGLPVVAPRIMGIPELVEDGVSGTLVTPAHVEELTSALRRQIEGPEERRRMGVAGRERVVSTFEVAECVRRVADLMRTVAAA
jgi:glycosyltransferase involved in cell wall biosynthesis